MGFTLILCLVCALGVSATAVGLKPLQDKNKLLFKQKNVLLAAGAIDEGDSNELVAQLFEQITQVIIERETGKVVEGDPESIDTIKLSKDSSTSEPIPSEFRRTMVKRISHQVLAYEVNIKGLKKIKGLAADHESPDTIECLVIPIRGNGLWGPMFGFIALSPDGKTVRGITYYQHKETPGLGGEVDNPSWKALWPGKVALDDTGKPVISVVKAGAVQNPEFEVDGMSGATITSKSVSNMLHLWLGDAGFGPYLKTKSGAQ
ncbi:MAG: NADH:ubiquinone reductase (Na(+)-transporting) subunit C [Planctomycetota bacterium]|nr:NADH:ubiquinone reductase (Na(+)-transporting) subunit C [Planctomycetota bacterium]